MSPLSDESRPYQLDSPEYVGPLVLEAAHIGRGTSKRCHEGLSAGEPKAWLGIGVRISEFEQHHRSHLFRVPFKTRVLRAR